MQSETPSIPQEIALRLVVILTLKVQLNLLQF